MKLLKQAALCAVAIREFVAPSYRPECHYMRGPGPACARRRGIAPASSRRAARAA